MSKIDLTKPNDSVGGRTTAEARATRVAIDGRVGALADAADAAESKAGMEAGPIVYDEGRGAVLANSAVDFGGAAIRGFRVADTPITNDLTIDSENWRDYACRLLECTNANPITITFDFGSNSGVVAAADAQSITLDAAEAAANNALAGRIVHINSTSFERVVAYDAATRIARLARPWPTVPTIGDNYTISALSGFLAIFVRLNAPVTFAAGANTVIPQTALTISNIGGSAHAIGGGGGDAATGVGNRLHLFTA